MSSEHLPLRVDIHVRPGASSTAVGGAHDGALVVRVAEPAQKGRATAAALRALAEALGLPPSCLTLSRRTGSHRKVVEVGVPEGERPYVKDRIARLLQG